MTNWFRLLFYMTADCEEEVMNHALEACMPLIFRKGRSETLKGELCTNQPSSSLLSLSLVWIFIRFCCALKDHHGFPVSFLLLFLLGRVSPVRWEEGVMKSFQEMVSTVLRNKTSHLWCNSWWIGKTPGRSNRKKKKSYTIASIRETQGNAKGFYNIGGQSVGSSLLPTRSSNSSWSPGCSLSEFQGKIFTCLPPPANQPWCSTCLFGGGCWLNCCYQRGCSFAVLLCSHGGHPVLVF